MDISVVYVNYKNAQLTVNSIKSLIEKTTDIKYEIIVIDNNSSDNSLSVIKNEFLNESLVLIQNEDNIGTSNAYNVAIEIAKGEFILFLNNDTILINNALLEMYKIAKSDSNIGVVGGNLFTVEGNPMHSYNLKFPSLAQLNHNARVPVIIYNKLFFCLNNKDFNSTDKTLDVGYVSAANMLVRSELFKNGMRFNSRIFMYGEETELCYKVLKMGFRVVNTPKSMITHLEGASFNNHKFNFNKWRFETYLNGNVILYESIYGKNARLKFLKIIYKATKNKILLSRLVLNKNLSERFKSELVVIKRYLRDEVISCKGMR